MQNQRPSSRTIRSNRASTSTTLLELLEQRQMLSAQSFGAEFANVDQAGPVGPVSTMRWNDFDYKVLTGSWLVSFKDKIGNAAAADLAARQIATSLGVTLTRATAVSRYVLEISTKGTITAEKIGQVVQAMPRISHIEPNRMVQTDQAPNDPRYGEQYAHDNTGTFLGSLGTLDADMDTPEAWDTTIGSRQQVVAVIDTGVQITHPDLAANIYTNPNEIAGNGIDDDNNGFIDDVHGWDFWDNENNPADEEGHGTHVSGIIGAVGNNGIGVVGMNWAVSILPIRVLGPFGGTIASIVGGIDYVTMMRENGAPIAAANASYGAPGSRLYEDTPQGFDAEKDAIARFIDEGGTFIAAAGNNGTDNDTEAFSFFPASYKIPGLISVAATDWDDKRASFSNYGAETVDLGAPGDEILSTFIGDSYAYLSGTSMAAPQVTGAVALMRSVKPNASAPEIRQTLIDSVDPIADLQGRTVSGGRLNMKRALDIIGLAGPVIRTVLPGPVTGQVDPTTNQPVKTLTVRFNRPIDASLLAASVVEVRRDGADNAFDTVDDAVIPVTSVVRSVNNDREITITLNVASLPAQRLALDRYRLTLRADAGGGVAIKDTDGNFLNGNSVSGRDEEYIFTVVPVSGSYEANDTLATATPVTFSASGTARFTGVTIGDGVQAALDVDIFKVTLARGGQITAEINAKRLPTGSSLDSYIRLFNANGAELSHNDQFYGQDSYIDYYVSTGGTYYIAVSGYGNDSYNPAVAASGKTQSQGIYSLTINANLNTDDLVTAATNFDAPQPIPATGTQGTITSELTITDNRSIVDANVQVRIRHSFISDLKITLISPTGTEVVLSNRRGGSGQDMTPTLFDDEAPQAISAGTAPFAGTFTPDEALGRFDGQTALGTWTLKIEDLSGANAGFLDGWRLDLRVENDIFGDFEPNDTIVNAKDLAQISGSGAGSATISAFLGDGGFGLLDRDFFKFTVNAGASLTAQVTTLADSAIRLFNAQGGQLVLASDPGSTNSRIENFVFSDAGTFYLAVSSGLNTAYDPFNVSTGVAMVRTGTYSLSVDVTDGVSDGSVLLTGSHVSVGMGTDGNLYSALGGGTGLRYNNVEFLFNSSAATDRPQGFFGASADGSVFLNSRSSTTPFQQVQLPFSITDQSDTFNGRAVGKALFNGDLRVERTISLGKGDSFAVIDVLLTNQGSTAIGDLSWMEGLNANMGLNLNPASASTANDIDASGNMATSSFRNNDFLQGLTLGLAAPSADSRATAMVVGNTIVNNLRDPSELLAINPVDPNGTSSDSYLSLVYNLGTLSAGQAASMRYFVFFGDTPAAVNTLYATLNAGTGANHLAANPSSPADETLSDNETVPQLPYRYYFPEGFATPNTSTFIPIVNPNDQSARVVVIARYETGVRDQVIADFSGGSSIAANSRSGVTITNPQLFAGGAQLVRPYEGYAIEVRSDRPIAPTFSHYDTNLTTTAASIGESFTTRVGTTWTFGEVKRGGTNLDFLLFYNTSDQTSKIESTFYPRGGGTPITFTQTVDAHRRIGLNLNDVVEIPEGIYGVKVTSAQPIVAVLSHYDTAAHSAEGLNGLPSLGATVGATSEGDLGRNSTSEHFSILNANAAAAQVSLVFLFTSGSSYRTYITVPAQSQGIVNVGDLVAFPVGEQYAMQYTSDRAVTVNLFATAFGDELISSVNDRAYRYWGFGEGFKPRDGNPLVTETLRLYNPSSQDTIAEIILRYDANLGEESLRVVVPARTAYAINVHDLVTGSRRNTEVWYGITVKSALPIIASFSHADAYFPGAFSTMGTSMGEGVSL